MRKRLALFSLTCMFVLMVVPFVMAQVATPSPTPVVAAGPAPEVLSWLSTSIMGGVALLVIPVVAFLKTKVKIPGALVPVVAFVLNAGLSYVASLTIAPSKFSWLTALGLTAVSTFVREVKVSVLGS